MRSALLEQAPHAGSSKEQRETIAAVPNTIHAHTLHFWESTSLFGALSALGALDDDADAHASSAENQLKRNFQLPKDVYGFHIYPVHKLFSCNWRFTVINDWSIFQLKKRGEATFKKNTFFGWLLNFVLPLDAYDSALDILFLGIGAETNTLGGLRGVDVQPKIDYAKYIIDDKR